MQRQFSVWKTTIFGGVIFLLPFAVIVLLLGQIVQMIYSVAGKLNSVVPQWSFGGVSLAVLLVTLMMLALCYAAGLAARRSLGRQFSEKVERNVLLFFPRYAIWKSQLTSNFGAGDTALRPVLVAFDDLTRIGFEIERTNSQQPVAASTSEVATSQTTGPAGSDAGETVTVYLPGSPDPWNGHVVHVSNDRVRPLAASFSEAAALCEAMGRGAGRLL